VSQLQASEGGAATPIIRPPERHRHHQALPRHRGADAADPYVQNPEEAKRAVEAVRYPPGGVRGVAVSSRASRYGRVTTT